MNANAIGWGIECFRRYVGLAEAWAEHTPKSSDFPHDGLNRFLLDTQGDRVIHVWLSQGQLLHEVYDAIAFKASVIQSVRAMESQGVTEHDFYTFEGVFGIWQDHRPEHIGGVE